MRGKEAAHGSCNYSRASNGSVGTRSILANRDMIRLAMSGVLFTFLCVAVPTAMAVLKQWGWW